MTTALQKKLLTAKEFSRLPNPDDGSRQKLVRGEVITMPPPSHIHGRVQVKIGKQLDNFLDLNPIGQVTVNNGVVTETDPDSVRGPDVAYWSIERMALDASPEVYPSIAPNLVVEIRSPGNRPRRFQEKIQEYFASGVQMVWVVNPDTRTVTVYRNPDEGRTLWEDATISGDDVIPGFSCPITNFFPPVPASAPIAAPPPANGAT